MDARGVRTAQQCLKSHLNRNQEFEAQYDDHLKGRDVFYMLLALSMLFAWTAGTLIATSYQVVEFTGAAWTNQPPVEGAPILTPTAEAWEFIVSGRFNDGSTKDGYSVTVRNTRTNAVATDALYRFTNWCSLTSTVGFESITICKTIVER